MDLVQACRLLGRGVARANTGLKKGFQGTVYVLTGKEFRGITFLIGAIRLFFFTLGANRSSNALSEIQNTIFENGTQHAVWSSQDDSSTRFGHRVDICIWHPLSQLADYCKSTAPLPQTHTYIGHEYAPQLMHPSTRANRSVDRPRGVSSAPATRCAAQTPTCHTASAAEVRSLLGRRACLKQAAPERHPLDVAPAILLR
jgi:hypothetical protein